MGGKRLPVPAAPKLYTQRLDRFKGVDFANAVTEVNPSRSPNAENIVSDLAGKPVKRTGYETVAIFGDRINGIFRLATGDIEKFLVHAGTKLYEWKRTDGVFDGTGTEVYSGMNNLRSAAFQHDKKMYILDGKTYLAYGNFSDEDAEEEQWEVKPVSEIAMVPNCYLALQPDGKGGRKRHDINVLTTKRTYSYLVTAETAEFHITADDSLALTTDSVTARVLGSDGKWVDKAETTDFTVDREKGIITFKSKIGATPSTGVDNVEITFGAEPEGDKTADLINKCTIAIQYGYNGATDRVFVSGNPDAVNFHYWSDVNDPTFFPALNYAYLGQDSSAIMGYSIIGDALAVHKEDNEQDNTIFLVRGSYDTNNGYQFAISGSVAGVGAISKHCFKQFGTEPMFLSRQGVYAVTTQYLTAEKYAQNRSWYINPKLTRETGLSEAVAIEYNGYYYLGVNGHVYVADSRNKTYEKNEPQSEFQYEWYYLTNISARVWWEYDGRLYFGDNDGKVKRFKLDSEDTGATPAYTDDGKVIRAFWDTPFFTFDTLSRYKTLKGFWILQSPYRRSSIKAYYKVKGDLRLVKTATMDIFDFNEIDFERFTFNTDDSPMVVATNAKAKRFMLIQFRLENDVAGEGFGFYEMEAAYNITGKYKG